MNDHFPRTANWKYRPTCVLKYVDDFLGLEKLYLGNGYKVFTTNREATYIHAPTSQDFFETVSRNAGSMGLSVNADKSQLLCLSPSNSTEVTSYIKVNGEATRIYSQETLKQVGFMFVDCYVDVISKNSGRGCGC